MSKSRIYVGNLSSKTREKDLQEEFEKYGKVVRVDVKTGFAFIEYDDERDAEEAIDRMDGETIDGRKVSVEKSKGGRGGDGRPPTRGGRGGGFRVDAEGLDHRVSWQDLKDFAREAGDVAFTDVWVEGRDKKGVIEYSRKSDMEEALRRLHDTKLEKHNCYIKLYAARSHSRSRSASRSRSRSRDRRRKSRSRSPRKSRSRSRSPPKKSGRSRSRSPAKKSGRSKSRSPAKKSGRSRSRSPAKKKSRSKSPAKKSDRKDKRRSPSPSRSRSR